MATQATSKGATAKQLAYIRRLQAELGEEQAGIDDEMSGYEASRLIGELIAKAQRNGAANGYRPTRINEARLGMAMKECYRQWVGYGRSVEGRHRELFIEYAIATYNLFTEIAQKVEQGRSIGAEAD